jgi:hypothetical protein
MVKFPLASETRVPEIALLLNIFKKNAIFTFCAAYYLNISYH